MPKERVRSRYHSDNGFQYYTPKSSDDYLVHLGWQKGGDYVEITTMNPYGKVVDHTGKVLAQEGGSGWFVNLDRKGINKLIRDLRKARDDAFGRDE